ncbi:MAG TPA: PucR family transcriptional regulator ligand-binding domain-containing protein [Solirubrobacteraceae bacterium]|jgi:purine catabolism regulator|nr:PucR family transcriptional regulator ligand-binding domain-containing protein [Solirubrobacteraceae bacterium]
MLTVRELLRGLDVRLVSGEEAIDAPVRWVHISELQDPTTWLSGGEVLLTTGMGLKTPEQQREFVGRLADHQLAALGFGVGFGHDEVPPALIQAAAEREFPVFAVPYEVPFIAVTEAAFTQLVNEQYAVLRRALAAHERLERVVLSERGLDALAGTLATLIGAAVLVFDARGEPLVQRAFRRTLEPDEVSALQTELCERRRGPHSSRAFLPSHPGLADRSLALPVAADGAPGNGGDQRGERVPQAWLVAIKDGGGPLSDFDRLTLHQAVTIVALELLRGRVAGDTERRLAGDVLAALVGGELTGAELARRLEPFGLSERAAAIVVPRPNGGRGPSAPVEDALAQALRDEAAPGLVASTGALTCGLVPGVEEDELFALAGRIAERLRTTTGAPLNIGVGRPVPGGDARRTFHEARCAVEALAMGSDVSTHNGTPGNGTRLATAPGVATYKDLGSFQLLLSLQDDEALRLFCDSILGPIEASEGHYGGELMRSLEAFIEENGQWERAARRLYCHRHTLRYRIRRVEELTGRNLSSARDRIEFWLALRGRELVA